MVKYEIDLTEDAKIDLSFYTAYERKQITTGIREQLTFEPLLETPNRKELRENPIFSWELRSGRYRVFYEVDETAKIVTVVSIGHKVHNALYIRGKKVEL